METKANQGPAQPGKHRDGGEQENMSDPHRKAQEGYGLDSGRA